MEDKFHKDSRLFELFTVKFVLDKEHNLYLKSISNLLNILLAPDIEEDIIADEL